MIAAIIVAVLVVVGGGVVAAIFLLGGGDDDDSGALGAAEAYVDAIRNGDCDAAADVSTDSFTEEMPCEDVAPPDDVEVEIGDPEITDETEDSATAEVSVTFEDQESTIGLSLVNEDGEWLVDGLDAGGGDQPSEPSVPTQSVPTDFSVPTDLPTDFTIPTDIPTDFTIPTS